MKEIVTKIKNFLNNNEYPEINKNVDDILTGIQILQDEKEVENIHEIIKDSRNILKALMAEILEIPLTKEYIEFVSAYCKLSYNFSLNTIDDPDVSLFSKFLNKIIELIRFTRVVIDIEKTANIRMNEWRAFNPPAFSVSKALLEEVLKDE